MDTSIYRGFNIGQPVETDDASIEGVITRMGSSYAEVTGYDGVVRVAGYGILKEASLKKEADRNQIKQEEKDGKKFQLDKEEKNVDGKMSVRYKVTVDGKEVWTSEELVTNVYDNEFGWSAPDDFDEGKLDLIQKTAESGFDMVVESFKNITDMAKTPGLDGSGEAIAPKEGKPAFAPGAKPEGGDSIGEPSAEGMPEQTGVEGENAVDNGVPVEETEKVAPEIPAESPTAEPATASLVPSRRIVSNKQGALKKVAKVTSTVQGLISYEIEGKEYEFNYTATLYYTEDHMADKVELEPVEDISEALLDEHSDVIREVALEDAYTKMVTGSITKIADADQRLHGNPEHRLNPILRKEMEKRHIDSGNTNDLELADKLKNFDYGKTASIKVAGKEYVIWGIPEGQDSEQLLLEAPGGQRITDKAVADKYVKLLESKFKAKKLRIQELDLSQELDWMKETGLKGKKGSIKVVSNALIFHIIGAGDPSVGIPAFEEELSIDGSSLLPEDIPIWKEFLAGLYDVKEKDVVTDQEYQAKMKQRNEVGDKIEADA